MYFLVLLLSSLVHADDACISSYDVKNPVVGLLEKSIGRSLISSQWVVCGGRAYVDETKCTAKMESRFKFGAEKSKISIAVNGLSDEKINALAKGMGTPSMYAPLIKSALNSGIPFSAYLCTRADKTTYARLVGTGVANGKGGIIEISQDEQGLRMSENIGADTGAAK